MFGSVSIWELLVVFLIILMIFGAGRLSDIGRGLGEGIANFIKGVKSVKEDTQAPGKEDTESGKSS